MDINVLPAASSSFLNVESEWTDVCEVVNIWHSLKTDHHSKFANVLSPVQKGTTCLRFPWMSKFDCFNCTLSTRLPHTGGISKWQILFLSSLALPSCLKKLTIIHHKLNDFWISIYSVAHLPHFRIFSYIIRPSYTMRKKPRKKLLSSSYILMRNKTYIDVVLY